MKNNFETIWGWILCSIVGVLLGGLWLGGCSSGGSDNPLPDVSACPASQTLCGSECASLQKDPSNCGACGTACGSNQVCSQGKCTSSCGTGLQACGQSCTSTQNDPANCGACGTKCAQGQVCAAGKCADTCGSSQTVCAGSCVDTQTDRENCGGCGAACGSGEICVAGQCTVSCQQGLTLCAAPDAGAADASTDAMADAATDGGALTYPACVDLQSDNVNCGACGVVCGAGTACSAGTCVPGCTNGQTLCTGDAGPAYCANTDSDNANCGACFNACAAPNTCFKGSCQIEHDDGLGEHWGDSVAYGTHDITQATAACQAYIAAHPADTCDSTSYCSCSSTHECVFNTAGGNGQTRRTWFFTGTLVGQVTDDSCTATNIPWN